MATPPQMRGFRQDDDSAGDVTPGVANALAGISATLSGLIDICRKRLNRADNFEGGARTGLKFTSPSSGNATVKFKYEQATRPAHVWCTDIERDDSSDLTSAYSMTWAFSGEGQIELSFQGLPASTDFTCSVCHE